MPRLFSYIITHDDGFAPHVDRHGKFLTLATCKPKIRKAAKVDDWILGVGGKELSNNSGKDMDGSVIYLAKVNETLDYDSYNVHPRFKGRTDNIYHSVRGKWIQKSNEFHGERNIESDTQTNCVLISMEFVYFGRNGSKLEGQYSELAKESQGHKTFDLDTHFIAKKFIEQIKQ